MALSKKLAAAIERDNAREDAGMHADDRDTCYQHQSWAADCEGTHRTPTAGELLAEAIERDRRRG